ncbi:MAG: hypothetical protein GF388_05410 [Candidatus Aegiribacteria sp.]|nr:hypothetical protein [Candidatus Aegiribacteria sp.]MBD3294641.1 hypothetical protein [Candidatus Fermentibacteria bacterium]
MKTMFLCCIFAVSLISPCLGCSDDVCVVSIQFDDAGREICRTFQNSSGETVLPKHFTYASIKVSYDVDGEIASLSLHDTEGEPAESNGWSSVVFTRDDLGRRVDRTFLDTNGTPCNDLSYTTLRVCYDEYGLETSRSHLNSEGDLVTVNGCAGVVHDHSEEGSLLETVYISPDSSPVTNPELGFARLYCDYYGDGIPIEQSWYDDSGQPAYPVNRGYAAMEYLNDSLGSRTESRLLDSSGSLTCTDYLGYSIVQWDYDEGLKNVEIRYLDEDSLPVTPVDRGYSVLVREYDSQGCEIRKRFLDEQGEPVRICFAGTPEPRFYYHGDDVSRSLNMDEGFYWAAPGHSTAEAEYDEHGNLIRVERFGPGGEPAELNGVSIIEYLRDENGKILEIGFHDSSGCPATPSMIPFAPRIVYDYDDRGRLVMVDVRNGEGECLPAEYGPGFSSLRIDYDESESRTTYHFQDSEGEPARPLDFWLLGLPHDVEYEDVTPELFVYSLSDFVKICPPTIFSKIVI